MVLDPGYPHRALAETQRVATRVPQLMGKGSHLAGPLIQEAGLAVGAIRLTSGAHVVAGVIVDQHPRPGREVEPGTPVDLTVASGQFR